MIMRASSILATLYFTLTTNAERDSNFYGSYSNPNLYYDHYWSSSKNVLEDFSKFDKLYVQFENCAWSTATYNSGDFDDDGDDGRRRRLEDNECGDGGGGEDNWWVGTSECKQSNVAFSLYGTLIDEPATDSSFFNTISRRRTSTCSKATFINSFFTIDGLHSFLKATQKEVNITGVVPYCSYYYDGDDDGSGSGDRRLDSGDNDNSLYYTTGCSASGNFTVDTFISATCNGNYHNETLYQLDELNEDIQNIECQQIYDSDGSMDYASTLLYYSETCSVSGLQKDFCPDPHGVLNYYEYNFAMAMSNNSYIPSSSYGDIQTPVWQLPVVEVTFSCLFILFGSLIIYKGIQI